MEISSLRILPPVKFVPDCILQNSVETTKKPANLYLHISHPFIYISKPLNMSGMVLKYDRNLEPVYYL